MPALKDLLSEEDKKKVEGWAEQAKNPQHETDIPPELYQLALHGAYFGFEAVEAALRGHIIDWNEDGTVKHIPYTLETMVALNKAARKVRYRQIVDAGDIQAAASASMHADRNYAERTLQRTNKIRRES